MLTGPPSYSPLPTETSNLAYLSKGKISFQSFFVPVTIEPLLLYR
jgi:hypothetical protein